eukprot:1136240-Pelagomonas_calceolata.AAC.13
MCSHRNWHSPGPSRCPCWRTQEHPPAHPSCLLPAWCSCRACLQHPKTLYLCGRGCPEYSPGCFSAKERSITGLMEADAAHLVSLQEPTRYTTMLTIVAVVSPGAGMGTACYEFQMMFRVLLTL